jgi:ubiquinone/menaquinone biosynthesis C-methylase UbiE
VGFGYIPDFRNKSLLKDLYLMVFGFPSAPRKNEARLVFKLLGEGSGRKLLDIGCGEGVWYNELRKAGADIIGLDISKEEISIARSRAEMMKLNPEMVVADAQSTPFTDSVFDKCFAISVLEHIPDDNKVFREAYRVLKPNGVFVTSMPTQRLPYLMKVMAGLPKIIKKIFASTIILDSENEAQVKRSSDMKFKHLRRYSEELLYHKAEEAGFRVEKIIYNLKFFGDFINGILHSFKMFEFGRKNAYQFKSETAHAIFFPVFYLLHLLDDLIPVKGCTIVARLVKEGNGSCKSDRE